MTRQKNRTGLRLPEESEPQGWGIGDSTAPAAVSSRQRLLLIAAAVAVLVVAAAIMIAVIVLERR
jgi:hypothetical protein